MLNAVLICIFAGTMDIFIKKLSYIIIFLIFFKSRDNSFLMAVTCN